MSFQPSGKKSGHLSSLDTNPVIILCHSSLCFFYDQEWIIKWKAEVCQDQFHFIPRPWEAPRFKERLVFLKGRAVIDPKGPGDIVGGVIVDFDFPKPFVHINDGTDLIVAHIPEPQRIGIFGNDHVLDDLWIFIEHPDQCDDRTSDRFCVGFSLIDRPDRYICQAGKLRLCQSEPFSHGPDRLAIYFIGNCICCHRLSPHRYYILPC